MRFATPADIRDGHVTMHSMVSREMGVVLPSVIRQHVDEAVFLWGLRAILVSGACVNLYQLRRADDRLAAHLDGLRVAEEWGRQCCEAALNTLGAGELFVASLRAIEDGQAPRLEHLLALSEAAPESQPGLISAFGWASAQYLQGTVKHLLSSHVAFWRRVGIAASTMHQVDSGKAVDAAIQSEDVALRGRALRAAGELARRDLLPACLQALQVEDPGCRFWAARSAVLLGDRSAGLNTLGRIAVGQDAYAMRALRLYLLASAPQAGHELLAADLRNQGRQRSLIIGAGLIGDPKYVLWLLSLMRASETARIAAEAFTNITGLDLFMGFDMPRPQDFEGGPNENPEDENVDLDPDEHLPWPDVTKIDRWWASNSAIFHQGQRYFLGQAITEQHCVRVLTEGYQRQRIVAALYRSLLQPGTPLFPTRAPAWRQKRWLAKMT